MTERDIMAEHPGWCDDAAAGLRSTRRRALPAVVSWVAGLGLLCGLGVAPVWAADATGPGPAIVNVVTFTVPAAGMARFLQLSEADGRASTREEPGCISFDVLRPQDQPDTVMLIETYRDEAAYKAHRVTAHFRDFVQGVQELGAKRSAHVATRFFHGGRDPSPS